MRICRRCGVYAPPETATCDLCNASLRDAWRDVARVRFRLAVARITRTCAACGVVTPVDGLPANGAVQCGGCGAEAVIPTPTWIRLLDRAHSVADLVGEDPEGFETSTVAIDQVNPFALEARRSAGVRFAHGEAHAVEDLPADVQMYVAPGVPIDGEAAEVLQFEVLGGGTLVTRSAGGPAVYEVGAPFVPAYPALAGVIGQDHRTDPRDPDVDVDADTGRWMCPACGGRLGSRDGTRYRVRCPTCGARAAVPRSLRYAGVTDARPEPVWLVFDGPSPERRRLERDPALGGSAYPTDRPLEQMALLTSTSAGRTIQLAYVVVVPVVLFALAGLVSRLPTLWGWLSRP